MLSCLVLVIRDTNVVQLDVDSEVDHVVGPVNLSSTDGTKPVFIGGAPGETQALLLSSNHFLGGFWVCFFLNQVLHSHPSSQISSCRRTSLPGSPMWAV